jgi:hypothetical protein
MIKRMILASFAILAVCTTAYGQLIVSYGGNMYLGGAFFIEDGIYPFFGVVLQLGYAFILPRDEDEYDDYY